MTPHPSDKKLAESLLFAKDGETADKAKLFAEGGNEPKGEARRGGDFAGAEERPLLQKLVNV